jgi:type II secretory pathway pseudopilin PulG
MTRRPRASSGAFSLPELLVIAAIIGIVASLLLPSAARARQAAGTARCIGNLRQMGIASQLYWDDHQGRTFSERTIPTNGGWRYWFGWLQDGAEGTRDFDPTQGALWPYAGGRGVEECPALPTKTPWYKPKGRALAYGYAYNLMLGPRELPGASMTTQRSPATLALFADGGQINTFLAPASPDHPMLEEFFYFDTNAFNATVHFRHRGRAETAVADGHVEPAPPDPTSLDHRLPPEIVGRLDPGRVVPNP